MGNGDGDTLGDRKKTRLLWWVWAHHPPSPRFENQPSRSKASGSLANVFFFWGGTVRAALPANLAAHLITSMVCGHNAVF